MRNSSSISRSFKAAVGSSMIRTRLLNDSALAISTICCSAMVSVPTSRRGSSAKFMRSKIAAAFRLSASSSRRPNRPRGSRPIKMFWATVSSFIKASSW